jgi:hypothetical protein
MNSIKMTAAATVTVAAVATLASPASARYLGDTGSGPAVSEPSPYATPVAALDGRTLAEYVADHHAQRLDRLGQRY